MTSITASVEIDAATRARMDSLAEKTGRSVSTLTREAVHQYLDRKEAEMAVRADALAAWVKFKTDGLHVSGEEADAWLAALENGEDIDPPACHV